MIRSQSGILVSSGARAGFPVHPPSQYASPSISTARKYCGKHVEASRTSNEASWLVKTRRFAVRALVAHKS